MARATPPRPTRRTTTKKTAPAARTVRSREELQASFESIVANIGKVIKGKDDMIRLTLTAIFANGHVLFEDLPGTGKTMLARSIAKSIDAEHNRIQCTPDLLPGDITGSPVLDRKTGDFVFRRGPVFANVFLADEINRASPKTQAALLEAMQERTVTVDGTTYPLPRPFFVLATQNPVEQAGTFPLPEAQLDRFLFKLSLGYPARLAEMDVLIANQQAEAIDALEPVIDTEGVRALIHWSERVSVSEAVMLYIIDLAAATRTDPAVAVGASPRASLALMRASRVRAAAQGRDDVLPDDVKALAMPVLAHRVILTADALLREESAEQVTQRVIDRVKVPTGLGSSGRGSSGLGEPVRDPEAALRAAGD
jgi:MoxR-like ATPase